MSGPESEILVALLRGQSRGMSVMALRLQTGRSDTTIRNHLRVMERYWMPPYVERVDGSRDVHRHQPLLWRLTAKGVEVARWRARP